MVSLKESGIPFAKKGGGKEDLKESSGPFSTFHYPCIAPGESPGQRSLVGYSPYGHKESDMTEQLNNNGLFYHFRIYRAENNSWRTGCVQ